MRIKIEIKDRFDGKVLFEYKTEGNTIKKTLVKAVSERTNLWGADLHGADLRGAELPGAKLRCANLCDADLRGTKLSSADLMGADLRDAYLQDANLRSAVTLGADLRGAYLLGGKIKTALVFTALHLYMVIPYITEEGVKRVKMARLDRSLEEWDSYFRNNNESFKSSRRFLEFRTVYQDTKHWLESAVTEIYKTKS